MTGRVACRALCPAVVGALLASAWLLAPAAAGAAPNLPEGFTVTSVTAGYTAPTAVDWAPDGRIFVAEKSGRVTVAERGNPKPRSLLDISDRVNSFGDYGLLGLAVDSDFEDNGYLYLLYTYDRDPLVPDAGGEVTSRLTRVRIAPDGTVANPADPERVLLGKVTTPGCPVAGNEIDCIPGEEGHHGIGTVRSAPDGSLWLGSGDATPNVVDDQAFRVWDTTSFAGKIIHVDRHGRGLPDHPFCEENDDLDDVCTKVYARGFRNPYRFALREGSGPAVGDVGSHRYEEVNLVRPGENYGWPCKEGRKRNSAYEEHRRCSEGYAERDFTGPDHDYPRGEGSAVVAGPIFAGREYPRPYRNDLYVADYVQGFIRRLAIEPDRPERVASVNGFATGAGDVPDLEQAPNGRLAYLTTNQFRAGQGELREIVHSPGNRAPVARPVAHPRSGPDPLAVRFSGGFSSDPDGDALEYDWRFGDGARSRAVNPRHTYREPGRYVATLAVEDESGIRSRGFVPIAVGNAPTAAISSPADGALYRDGEPVGLEGSADDAEDGPLTGDALEWQVLLHHGSHVHLLTTLRGEGPSFTPLTDHDADSFYEVRLTATDSDGLSDSSTIELRPKTVSVSVESSPPGAPVTYGESAGSAPLSVRSAVGYRASVSAADSFERDGRRYVFSRWSDGGGRLHAFTVPDADVTLVAEYEERPSP